MSGNETHLNFAEAIDTAQANVSSHITKQVTHAHTPIGSAQSIYDTLTSTTKDDEEKLIYAYLIALLARDGNLRFFFMAQMAKSNNPASEVLAKDNPAIRSQIDQAFPLFKAQLELQLAEKLKLKGWMRAYQMLGDIISFIYAIGCGLSVLGGFIQKLLSPVQRLALHNPIANALLPSFLVASYSTFKTNWHMVYADVMDFWYSRFEYWYPKGMPDQSVNADPNKGPSTSAFDVLTFIFSIISGTILAVMTWSYMSEVLKHIALLSPALPILNPLIIVIGIGTFFAEFMLTKAIFPGWLTLSDDIKKLCQESKHPIAFSMLFAISFVLVVTGMTAICMSGISGLQSLPIGQIIPQAIEYVLLGLAVIAQFPFYMKSAAGCITQLLTTRWSDVASMLSPKAAGRFYWNHASLVFQNWLLGSALCLTSIAITTGLSATPLGILIPSVIGIGFLYSTWMSKIAVNKAGAAINNAVGNGMLADDALPTAIASANVNAVFSPITASTNSIFAGWRAIHRSKEQADMARDDALGLIT